jgi:uncharacterized protein DUF4157
MSQQLQSQVNIAPAPKLSFVTTRGLSLQPKCACGGSADMSGKCEECQAKRLSVNRYAADRGSPSRLLASPSGSAWSTPLPDTGAAPRNEAGRHFGRLRVVAAPPGGASGERAVSQPGDRSEVEADRAAEQVMRALSSPVFEEEREEATLSQTPPLIQRAAMDEGASEMGARAEATTTPETAAPEETPAPGLIAEDEAQEVGPGQMRKSEFLDQLRAAVCAAADAELAAAGRSTEGCPYIERAFERYRGFSAAQLERALRRYAPEAAGATTARDYIPAASERVRRAVAVWAITGKITGAPEGMMAARPEAGPAKGAESAASAPGGIQFKGQDGGAVGAGNPAAIQAQLGSGQALDAGVRSRMESAFGYDFSRVRVHTDAKAAELSSDLRARAFTIGSDVAFRAGEYRPGTLIGDALIAHELAHVVQQSSGALTAASKDDASEKAFEDDADSAAVGAVLSLWGKAQGKLSRVARNVGPSLRSGLRVRRCNGDEATPDVTPDASLETPAPTSKPEPPPKPLYEQFPSAMERQKAIDKAVGEMSGKIDTSLLEGGKMFYDGTVPGGEGTTYPPNDKDLKKLRKVSNKKPYVEIYGAAFGDGWPLLKITIWHEYQHVLQMSPKSTMVAPSGSRSLLQGDHRRRGGEAAS